MVHRRPFGAESQGTPWGWELPRPGSPPSCISLLPTPGVWGPNNTTPPPPPALEARTPTMCSSRLGPSRICRSNPSCHQSQPSSGQVAPQKLAGPPKGAPPGAPSLRVRMRSGRVRVSLCMSMYVCWAYRSTRSLPSLFLTLLDFREGVPEVGSDFFAPLTVFLQTPHPVTHTPTPLFFLFSFSFFFFF